MSSNDSGDSPEIFNSSVGLRAEICACGTVHLHLGFLHLKFSRGGLKRLLGFLQDIEGRIVARENARPATDRIDAPKIPGIVAKA